MKATPEMSYNDLTEMTGYHGRSPNHDRQVAWPIGHCVYYVDIDQLVQERRNSSVLAMELRLSSTNPSMW